jgi:TRAP-type C4-dicarboxylate transport system substrate-binding protein
MSPEQQQAFRAAYSLIAEEAVEVFYQQREINTQRALDMGVTITTLTPEQKQVWIDAVTWMYSDYPYIDSDFESWYMGFVEANAVESDRF